MDDGLDALDLQSGLVRLFTLGKIDHAPIANEWSARRQVAMNRLQQARFAQLLRSDHSVDHTSGGCATLQPFRKFQAVHPERHQPRTGQSGTVQNSVRD